MSSQRTAMHAGEAVAEALREEGVERVYSVPGSHIHPIYDGLSRVKSIRFVTCKQEPNVSLMADAYGRLTGKPGVCVVTAGPGGLNSMAGVAQAYGAASPMVHIGGAVPLKADLEAFHGVDDPAFVHEMFKKITKWSARVERIEDIPEVMAKAFHIARSGRPGPVHVELPRLSDYSEYILQEERAVLPAYQPVPTVVTRPDPHDVDRFAKRLMESRSPVIAAGKGIIRRGAMRELSELSMKLQAPVIFAQDAIGVIPETHPFFAGHFQHYRSHPLCVEALKRTDLVFAVGLRAGTAEMTELRERAPERNLILVGFDDAMDARYQGEDQRVADPKLFLTALLERLGNYQRPRDEALIKQMAEGKAAVRRSLAAQNEPHRNDQPIHPGVLMDAMNAVLDDNAVVSSDVGNCQMWARTYPPHRDSRVVHAVRRLERHELRSADGDRGQDGISRARRGGARRRRRISHDHRRSPHRRGVRGERADGHPQRRRVSARLTCSRRTSTATPTAPRSSSPNFAEIAKACGAEGIRVSDPKEVEGALRQALAATKRQPALVEVMVAERPYPKM